MATMTFNFTALNNKGKQVTGSVPAETRAAAIAVVSSRGLSPLSVVEAKAGAANANMVPKAGKAAAPQPTGQPAHGGHGASSSGGGMGIQLFKPRVSQKDVETFTREMASLLAGGVPLARGLSLLMR